MLVYDLICSQGHRFEGWFKDLEDLESQLAVNSVLCPLCNDTNINRLPSTFGLVKSTKTASNAPKPEQAPDPKNQIQELIQRWADFSARMEKDFDDVGANFAEEALKMHYGATTRRNIRGQSTEVQEDMLRREGVNFFKVPMFRKNDHFTKN